MGSPESINWSESKEDLTPSWVSPEEAFLLSEGTQDGQQKPDYVLYSYPHSYNCLKVMMALHQKSIPFTQILVNIHLGHQFHDDFLKINSKAEVPVLRNRRTGEIFVNSDSIIQHLDKLFTYTMDRKYMTLSAPKDSTFKIIHDWFLSKLHNVRLDTLTYGSVMFDQTSLGISPNYPYNYTPARLQLQERIKTRAGILKFEAKRLEKTNPKTALALRQKAEAFENEIPFMTLREKYEEVIVEIELLLDNCEAQLCHQGMGFFFVENWLTQVDINFSLFLYRLWQLGFEKKFWGSKKRKYIQYYFERMKLVPSFEMVTHVKENKVITWPYVTGAILCLIAFTYEFLFQK